MLWDQLAVQAPSSASRFTSFITVKFVKAVRRANVVNKQANYTQTCFSCYWVWFGVSKVTVYLLWWYWVCLHPNEEQILETSYHASYTHQNPKQKPKILHWESANQTNNLRVTSVQSTSLSCICGTKHISLIISFFWAHLVKKVHVLENVFILHRNILSTFKFKNEMTTKITSC